MNEPKVKPKGVNILKYSGLAFQLAALVGLSAWLGLKVDGWLEFKIPIVTIVLILAVFGSYMYKLYKDLFSK
ncbi:MAG: AtpZ/AtpI family protein [Saprospiraceae bacterium]|nr:AtpZ/AtpI family protein [Saprospiraceae bacterium]